MQCIIYWQTIQFFRTKTLKIQDIDQDILELVDPISTIKVYKNEVQQTYEIDISNNLKTHKGIAAAPRDI